MSRVIIFHMNNSRDEYSNAFRIINENEVVIGDTWAKEHISFYTTTGRKKLKNDYADTVLQCEANRAKWRRFAGALMPDDVFYFRVINKMENDVINLHYYFLASKHIGRKSCLAILQGDTKKYVESSIISSFLLYETLEFNRNNEFKIVKMKPLSNKKQTTQYLVELSSNDEENIFLLRHYIDEVTQTKHELYPYRINKKRLSIAHSFFPQLTINKENLCLLRKMAKVTNEDNNGLYKLAKEKWDNRNKSEMFYKDVLSSIALRGIYQDVDLYQKESIEKYCEQENTQTFVDDAENTLSLPQGVNAHNLKPDAKSKVSSISPVFPLPKIDLIVDILSEYCKKCLEEAIPRIPKALVGVQRKEFNKKRDAMFVSLEQKAETTSVLAFCLFMAFLSFISREKDSKFFESGRFIRDDVMADLLTDAQDYADGIFQLLENAVIHSEKEQGIFCLRVHHTGKDENVANDSRVYLKERYGIHENADDTSEKEYFLEVLFSDYNTMSDIPMKFEENIRNNEDDYITMSPEFVNRLTSFKLKDFFDYKNKDTGDIWREFYKKPQNLISHYGLLVFEHLVSFAGGAFRLYSSNVHQVGKDKIYSNIELNHEKNIPLNLRKPMIHIPGTQYEILLPIGLKHNFRSTGLNAALEFDKDIIDWKAEFIAESVFAFIQTESNDKKMIISDLERCLWQEIEKIDIQKAFPCFDASKTTTPLAAEVFAKTIIKILGTHDMDAPKFFALINATDGFLATFIRVFALIYMKTGQSDLMKGRQLYLCSPSADKEIVFYGNSLRDSVNATYEISTLNKGQPLHEARILSREEEKALDNTTEDSMLSASLKVFPFDCVIPGLYQGKVKADLQRSIRDEQFGCCIEQTHMRVGSKIHTLGDYFEASLLFSISSYISRFAFFLYKTSLDAISQAASDASVDKIVLVGYETYSESLMINLKEYLEELPHFGRTLEIDYVIYFEVNNESMFTRWEEVNPNDNTRFIVVVPIGSTLTTHDKIASDLSRKMRVNYTNDEEMLDAVILHHCVVLIRNSKGEESSDGTGRVGLEKEFWQKIQDTGDRQYVLYGNVSNDNTSVVSIGAKNIINLFVSVGTEWYLPNKCEACFPKPGRFLNERPLIQSNRASVVPMIMYGRNNEHTSEPYVESFDDTVKKLAPLREGLCYGHVVRNEDNHYEYYFQTDKVMDAVLGNGTVFKEWLHGADDESIIKVENSGIRNLSLAEKLKPAEGVITYDFIVAPLHETNASFVHEINKVINAKQIIWLDIKREYRSNIETKYSNLRVVYDNLTRNKKLSNTDAEIRFHFIDDAINSGSSFFRARGLLQSLFPPSALSENGAGVKVRLFESVIILMSRCSKSTKLNFVADGHFHSYIDLNISSMRSHNDACVACKNESNFTRVLNKGAATNMLSRIALEKAKKYRTFYAEDIGTPESMITRRFIENQKHQKEYTLSENDLNERIYWLKDRGYYRMVASHRFNCLICTMTDKENTAEVVAMIWNELNGICTNNSYQTNDECIRVTKDRLFSALKVISRPFLAYKKSVLEAALPIILEISGYCLAEEGVYLQGANKINVKAFVDYVRRISKDEWGENPYLKLLKLLFSCLANMNSTYIFRANTINSVLRVCESMDSDEATEFISDYTFYAKQVLCLSGKDSLSVWLENLLIDDTEPNIKHISKSRTKPLSGKYMSDMKLLLRLENTVLICDALEECKKAFRRNMQWAKTDEVNNLLSDVNYDKTLASFADVSAKTLNQYFCNDYRNLVGVPNSADQRYYTHCNDIFAPMVYLCYLLDESYIFASEEEGTFYNRMLDLASIILGVENKSVGLFVNITNSNKKSDTYQLFPKPGDLPANLDNLGEFLDEIALGNTKDLLVNVGDTLFIKREDKACTDSSVSLIAAIKMHNNKSNEPNVNNAEFFIVFMLREEVCLNTDETIDCVIIKVRNLLSMRDGFVRRLSTDYDNNALQHYIVLQEKVRALANDRSGNHVPFEDILQGFSSIEERTEKLLDECKADGDDIMKLEEIKSLSYALELTVDALISKLYVLGVFDMLPEQLIDEITEKEDYIKLQGGCFDRLETLVPLIACFTRIEGNNEYNLKLEINPKIYTVAVYLVKNGSHIWLMMLIASMLNALHHGFADDTGTVECRIDLYPNSEAPNAILVENRYIKTINEPPGGITRKALEKFFKMLSKLDNLIIDDDTPADSTKENGEMFFYRIYFPIKSNEEDML